MASRPFYSFSPKTTTISFSWPKELTGLERVVLSAQGDLQRVLSASFARPIVLALIYSHTFTRSPDDTLIPLPLPNPSAVSSASAEFPIVQNRQVHLQCGGKLVCTATSTVKISSPRCAHLFLEEKYGIGQLFSKIGATPSFELLDVGIGGQDDLTSVEKGSPQLWRKYRLSVSEIDCEILEVFASRDMLIHGESWLEAQRYDQAAATAMRTISFRRPTTNTILCVALLSHLAFELYRYLSGSRCV